MRILLHYIKPYKWLVLLALLLAATNQVFSLFAPMFSGKLLDLFATHPHHFDKEKLLPRSENDYLFGTKGYHGIFFYLLLLVATAMASRIAKAFQDYFVNVIIQKFGATIFTDGLKHSMLLPFQDFEDQRSGETLSILTKVRTDTEKFISNFVNVFFVIIVSIVFVSVYAFRLHWAIMPVYALGIFFIALVTSLLSKKIKLIQKKIVRETTTLAGTTTESLRNIEIVKSLGLTGQEINRLNSNTFKILQLELKKVKNVRSLSFIQGTLVNFLQQVITFTLLWLIFKGSISPGEYLSLMFYGFFLFGPMQEIGNIILSYREAEASLQNFDTLMQKKAEQQPLHPKHLGILNALTFQQVSFQHQTAQFKALDNISFDIKEGETIAFVGPSGSGKSTLVKLLVGLYRPQEGQIYYNGIDRNDIDFETLRQQIGFVTQDTQLFAGSIRENLLFVNTQATEEELVSVLQKASCSNLLERAGDGIDTIIGESGLKLSGGEKQRIAIARALLRNPHLLLFDEATSALDSITEEQITETIRAVSSKGSQITILIAHRLSTIMHADKIYVLERGKIVETGSHLELLSNKGLYYAMWRQQIGERRKTQTAVLT